MYREEVRPPGFLLKAGGGQPVQAQQLQPAASALLLHLVRGIATRKVTLQPQSSLMVCSPLRQWCCNQQQTEKSESPICLGIMSLIKYTSLLSQEHFCKVMETQTYNGNLLLASMANVLDITLVSSKVMRLGTSTTEPALDGIFSSVTLRDRLDLTIRHHSWLKQCTTC